MKKNLRSALLIVLVVSYCLSSGLINSSSFNGLEACGKKSEKDHYLYASFSYISLLNHIELSRQAKKGLNLHDGNKFSSVLKYLPPFAGLIKSAEREFYSNIKGYLFFSISLAIPCSKADLLFPFQYFL